jgi:hypothetical protein
MHSITINNILTDKDHLHFNKTLDRNKVCMRMKIHPEKVFLLISSTLLKGKTKLTSKSLNRIGGSFDLSESSLKEEGIIVHLQTTKSFMFMVEKILELVISIICGALIFLT